MSRLDRLIAHLEDQIGPDIAHQARMRALRWRNAPRRWLAWWKEPFTTFVHYYEGARIEHRAFPYKLKLSAVEPLRDQIKRVSDAGGGIVSVPDGTHLLTRPIDLTDARDITLQDMVFRGDGITAAMLWRPERAEGG